MIKLNEYVFLTEEASPWSKTLLGTGLHNWTHEGDYKYAKTILNWILNPDDDTPKGIYIGKDTDKDKSVVSLPIDLNDKEKKELQDLLENISKKSIKDFDSILSNHGLTWKNINKAQLSGVSSNGNKGNQFEIDFMNDFDEKWESKIKSIVGCNEINGKSLDGSKNKNRPYHFNSDGSITAGKEGSYDIGSTITDITLDTDKGNVYLSLKSGKLLSFANIGCIGKKDPIIPRSWYDSDDELPKKGKALLDILGIDETRYKEVFKGRKNTSNSNKVRKANYVKDDVTDILKNNKNFLKFVRSCIGCGYIMVHQNSEDDVDFIDLRSESKLNELTAKIIKAEVYYPTDAKRVEVHVDMPGIWLSFDLRPADGGPVPNRVHTRYNFK